MRIADPVPIVHPKPTQTGIGSDDKPFGVLQSGWFWNQNCNRVSCERVMSRVVWISGCCFYIMFCVFVALLKGLVPSSDDCDIIGRLILGWLQSSFCNVILLNNPSLSGFPCAKLYASLKKVRQWQIKAMVLWKLKIYQPWKRQSKKSCLGLID